MTLNRKLIKEKISKIIDKRYNLSLEDSDLVICSLDDSYFNFFSKFRIQYNRLITFEGFSNFSSKKIEKEILNIVEEELKCYYDDYLYFTPKDFYKTNYDFTQEILSEEHLEEFLNEFVKCLEYHEKEVFPKLLDINFLAEYVGSVPFENQLEIPVGGKYPVSLFKKLAILKWGGEEEKYLLYKKGLAEFIKEDFKDPKYGDEAPTYKKGYLKLIKHLEEEPNPLIENNIC